MRCALYGLLAMGLAGTLLAATGLIVHGGAQGSAALDFAAIDQRVRDWQPTAEERRVDEIGWAGDLREALRLAKENDRPVFLFTYSGEANEPNAIGLQRC